MAEEDVSYEVGYGKPSRESQFQKGKSGNQRGRPKGARSIATVALRESRRLVQVNGPRGSRQVPKLEAAMMQLANKAAQGDLRAVRELSRELAKLLGVSHMTAGSLIKENAADTYQATAGLKAVPHVEANQMLLLSGLAKYRIKNKAPLLLDGHFVLLEPGGTIAEIPIEVYEVIAPVAVMLVEAAPETVHARLIDRDGEALPTSTIAELARRERLHAGLVCQNLTLPLRTVSTDGTIAEALASAAFLVRAILGEEV